MTFKRAGVGGDGGGMSSDMRNKNKPIFKLVTETETQHVKIHKL